MEGWLEGDGCVGFSAGGEGSYRQIINGQQVGGTGLSALSGIDDDSTVSPAVLHQHTLFLVQLAAKIHIKMCILLFNLNETRLQCDYSTM